MDLLDTTLHTFKAVPNKSTPDGTGMNLDEKRAALKKTAKEFESVFMFQMVEAMRKTVPQNDGSLIKKSNGEKIFEGMLDEEWAKRLSGQGGETGLSGMIYRQLSRKMGLEEDARVNREDQGMALPSAQNQPALPLQKTSALLQLQHNGAIRLKSEDQSGDGHE